MEKNVKMTAPKLEEYMLPVLKVFEDQQVHRYQEIMDALADTYDLFDRDLPKRAFLMVNNCIGYFLKAQLLEKKAEKTFEITARGVKLLQTSPNRISVKALRQFKEFDEFIKGRYAGSSAKEQSPEIANELPEERIEASYEDYKTALASDLLDKVKQCSWQFFEVLVRDLLVAMGYGDPHDEAKLKRGPGDEGIDGMIKEDRLGLDTICLQAKKWDNTVGRPEIQKFAGSLEGKRVKKGVFITTADFSKEAYDYINMIEKKIVLINGQKLSGLMIDYGIGVSDFKVYTLNRVDSDYFDV